MAWKVPHGHGGTDPAVTQAWAAALRRAGWLAVHHGIQNDPSGAERGVALFDLAGEHPPYDDAAGWRFEVHELATDQQLIASLAGFGVEVLRSDPQLPEIDLDATGLI